ncbi:MAG: hypothetical protein IJ776_10810 [Paludibacteraceae bacterium]|nr:hypothetical protein [Paludibacteraceae bacterium]
MKKCLFLFVLAVAFIACNSRQPQYCDDYPYCISEFSIHPEHWLCGRLKPEPSPFDKKDTVVAMTIKYVYSSDMNGLTYFITKNNELFSLSDESGKRKESIEMTDYKGKNFKNMPFVLYPYKSIEELPSEVIKCDLQERAERAKLDSPDQWCDRCLEISSDGVLIFGYEMEITGGQTYETLTNDGDTIHLFDLNEESYFNDVFYPI